MGYASQAYGRGESSALAPRDVEAAAFLFVNRALEEARTVRDRVDALCKNQKLWSLLLRDLACSTNALPDVLKQDLVDLARYAMRTSIRAMGEALPLRPLIELNRDMAEALRAGAAASPAIAPARPALASFAAAV